MDQTFINEQHAVTNARGIYTYVTHSKMYEEFIQTLTYICIHINKSIHKHIMTKEGTHVC